MKSHIYLSPHLDDAILSCGGLIHRQRASGAPVTVINLCAGVPGYYQLSPFAEHYHKTWGNLPDLVSDRRAEDRAVLSKLGVTAHNLDTPDSIYRRVNGAVAYPDLAAMFAEPHPRELDTLPRLWHEKLERLYSDSADAIVYAPLAAGNHVDHQLVRTLALRLIKDGWQVSFYEDYPYVEGAGALSEAQATFGSSSWRARIVSIDVNAKITSIRGYKTQVPFIFGDEDAMVRRVKRFTAETARTKSLAERVRSRLAGLDGRRERVWRTLWGYHAHAERIWRPYDA